MANPAHQRSKRRLADLFNEISFHPCKSDIFRFASYLGSKLKSIGFAIDLIERFVDTEIIPQILSSSISTFGILLILASSQNFYSCTSRRGDILLQNSLDQVNHQKTAKSMGKAFSLLLRLDKTIRQ